jgi:hypothetical protein
LGTGVAIGNVTAQDAIDQECEFAGGSGNCVSV